MRALKCRCYDQRINLLQRLVRDLGTLYCYSLFGFKGLNEKLLKLVHGTEQAQMQISISVSVLQKLLEMAYSCLEEGTEAHNLYCGLSQNSSENEGAEPIFSFRFLFPDWSSVEKED